MNAEKDLTLKRIGLIIGIFAGIVTIIGFFNYKSVKDVSPNNDSNYADLRLIEDSELILNDTFGKPGGSTSFVNIYIEQVEIDNSENILLSKAVGCSVIVTKAYSSKIEVIDGSLTDLNGVYKARLPNGEYNVRIEYVGHNSIILKDLILTGESRNINVKLGMTRGERRTYEVDFG